MLKDIYNSLLSKKQEESNTAAWNNEDILENQAQLFFSIKSIKGLKILDNPIKVYCLASLEKQSVQTSSITINKDQVQIEWNEGYTFDVISSKSILALSIWQGNANVTIPNNSIDGSSSGSNNSKLVGKLYIPFATFKKQFCDQCGGSGSNSGSAQNSPYNSLRNTPPSIMSMMKMSGGSGGFERMSPGHFSPISVNKQQQTQQQIQQQQQQIQQQYQQPPLLQPQPQFWVQPQHPNHAPQPQLPILSKLQETTFERRRSLSVNAQTQFTLVLDPNEE
ncbi:hypothetical protein RB653_008828 [Dictyostelium firmibasis]|uniref:Uncharacterized protein n=1 Tax=Dictyostelium firmibasis TaxID=79012 RepID=A0AAN7TTC3_9MYCE